MVTLSKALLLACFDYGVKELVPLKILKRIQTVYKGARKLGPTVNPELNVQLLISGHEGQLIIEELFDKLEQRVKEVMGRDDIEFVKTQELDLDKEAYYRLLAESKCVVSYALQENFGFGIAEAAYLGCTPVLPNRLVYPELYDEKYLYDTHEESVIMVCDALQQQDLDRVELNCDPLKTWFGQGE